MITLANSGKDKFALRYLVKCLGQSGTSRKIEEGADRCGIEI